MGEQRNVCKHRAAWIAFAFLLGAAAAAEENCAAAAAAPAVTKMEDFAVLTLQSTVPLRGGHSMPLLGLGTFQMAADGTTTKQAVLAAIGAGYRMIDTAANYQTETEIGVHVHPH